jgi:hypothetical protein
VGRAIGMLDKGAFVTRGLCVFTDTLDEPENYRV